MEQAYPNNRLILAGLIESEPTFSHAVRGVNFKRFFLAVERTSGAKDVLPVLIAESALPNRPLFGEHAAVTGQIRSYLFTTSGGVDRLLINAFAKSINLTEGLVNLNETELTGTLARPVTYRTTPRLREIADLLISVQRGFQKEDLIPAIAWGRNARCARELRPGDRVHIQGRLQSRSYTKLLPDGAAVERNTYEVSVSNLILL